ncbi:DUF5753 domain-containing protein [Actinomadura fulvescens]|uniref:Helix-turn-helix transcriptional regulator n=1 Tax=Actinomadura fulvescens TaxID=46160 RepID=A0ABN3R215_9ACTN
MAEKAAADSRASMWDLMGSHLRFLRKTRGLTGVDAAAVAACAPSTISRIETGEQHLTEKQAAKIDKAWNTGGILTWLIYYARRASDPDWFRSVTAHEEQADELRIFAALHVPGLVQNEDYARALLESGRDPDVQRSLADRMSRQKILTRRNPPDLWITLSENVLDWPVGDAGVMRRQLERLLELSWLRNVVFRVLPRSSGASEALDGPFRVVTTPDGPVAFCEAAKEGRLVSEAADVNEFRNRFERICAKALSESQSRDMVCEKMERLYGPALA